MVFSGVNKFHVCNIPTTYSTVSTTATSTSVIRFAAVGDLLLAPPPGGQSYPRNADLVAPGVRALFSECDVVFGNLECTLPGDGGRIPVEPRVIATPELIRGVKRAGFGVVTLANNHAFDCLGPGYENLRRLLAAIDLPYFGAGRSRREAVSPLILERQGVRLGFLGVVDERSGASRFATGERAGVAPLEMEHLVRHVHELRQQVDHVIVSLHWGEERFLIPSPVQIQQAHEVVAAGASLVIGHHPHVLQGLEMVRGVPVIYSLGNFIADEVYFTNGDANRWNRTGRTGSILMVEFTKAAVRDVRQVPTFDGGTVVDFDNTSFGHRRVTRTARALARGVTFRRYRREHLWVKTVKPALARLHWRRLKELRPRHLRKAFDELRQAKSAE